MPVQPYLLRDGHEPVLDLWRITHFERIPDQKVAAFTRAHHCSLVLHTDKLRESGESYYRHDARCALMAAESELPIEMVIVMFAHEFVEDDGWKFRKLLRYFGPDVAAAVDALSKRPKQQFPDPEGRQKRALDHIERMKQGTLRGPILDGRYRYNWLVPMGKALDRFDNSTDTAGIRPEKQERLFEETDSLFLPYFGWALPYIPARYRPVYRLVVRAISNNCDNYWRSQALRE